MDEKKTTANNLLIEINFVRGKKPCMSVMDQL